MTGLAGLGEPRGQRGRRLPTESKGRCFQCGALASPPIRSTGLSPRWRRANPAQPNGSSFHPDQAPAVEVSWYSLPLVPPATAAAPPGPAGVATGEVGRTRPRAVETER